MKTLQVDLTPSYPLYFSDDLYQTDFLANFLRAQKQSLVIIADENLSDQSKVLLDYLKSHQLSAALIKFSASESNKTRETKAWLEDQLFQQHYGRDTYLIALGGGITTDIVGYVAATYCRGIGAVYLPTSLLAMVDASVGGKTGVNTPYGKNLVGSFYQPKAVFISRQFLISLPEIEYQNGLVELIKHALIADKKLFERGEASWPSLHPEDIFDSCEIKKKIVEQDEREENLRQLLNFGHTIGHAIEILEDYQIRHGIAVAMGILVEAYLSWKLNFLSQETFEKICTLMHRLKLPLQTKAFQDPSKFCQALMLDKKSKAKQPRFVLLDNIGEPHCEQGAYAMPVPEALVFEALNWANHQFNEEKNK